MLPVFEIGNRSGEKNQDSARACAGSVSQYFVGATPCGRPSERADTGLCPYIDAYVDTPSHRRTGIAVIVRRYFALRDADASFNRVQSTIFSIGTAAGTSAMLATFFKPLSVGCPLSGQMSLNLS